MGADYPLVRLGKNIKNARKKQGFSQTELVQKIGVGHRNGLISLEAGKQSPTWRTLCRIAGALAITVEELLFPEHVAERRLLRDRCLGAAQPRSEPLGCT